MTRSWRMFAGRPDVVVDGREFHGFDTHIRMVERRGYRPFEVELTEDPDGQYWGWIHAASDRPIRREYTGIPVMIRPAEVLFRIQSPDGFRADVEAGRGEIVRMSCRAVSDQA